MRDAFPSLNSTSKLRGFILSRSEVLEKDYPPQNFGCLVTSPLGTSINLKNRIQIFFVNYADGRDLFK